jgi:hypothetical protein
MRVFPASGTGIDIRCCLGTIAAGTDGNRLKGGHQAKAVVIQSETPNCVGPRNSYCEGYNTTVEKMPESAILHTIRHVYLSV